MDALDDSGIANKVAAVREKIAAAAYDGGRDPESVALVAATKMIDVGRIRAALAAGIDAAGENRAQELLEKAPQLTDCRPAWHFIGRLQRNKVRLVAPWVTCWESVDRVEIGTAIAHHAPGAVVLVQVNVGNEPQKGGCEPAGVDALVDQLRHAGLDVRGLMAVPPQGSPPRPFFDELVALADALALPERSIGMSQDYEIAVSAGATIVRVGHAIFGDRRSAVNPEA